MKKYLIFVLIICFTSSCNSPSRSSDSTKDDSLLSDSVYQSPENKIEINLPNVIEESKILDEVYVLKRDGVDLKETNNENSKTLNRSEYGSKLDVIEIFDNWYAIQIRIENNNIQKVFIPKKFTGKARDVQINEDDLYTVTSFTKNGKTQNSDIGFKLNGYLKIEIIQKDSFLINKLQSVNFLTADTLPSKKHDGVIELKCEKKVKRYVDIVNKSQNVPMEEFIYSYVGQIEFLNKYVVYGEYWENSDYKFIDKSSGEETQSFKNYPNISPDKKYFISMRASPYTYWDFELFEILDKQTKLKFHTEFKNWMPTLNNNDIFFAKDGYLYFKVLHANVFFDQQNLPNANYQFLRMKLF